MVQYDSRKSPWSPSQEAWRCRPKDRQVEQLDDAYRCLFLPPGFHPSSLTLPMSYNLIEDLPCTSFPSCCFSRQKRKQLKRSELHWEKKLVHVTLKKHHVSLKKIIITFKDKEEILQVDKGEVLALEVEMKKFFGWDKAPKCTWLGQERVTEVDI